MSGTAAGVEILNVLHESRVAAIQTAAGPRRLLDAGLAERLSAGESAARVTDVPPPDADSPGEVAAAFAVAAEVARLVSRAAAENRTAVVLSGSCHTAIGSVSGLAASRRGIVWLDCHGDLNTPETTGSGLLDGTVLASITGRCWKKLSAGVPGFSPVPDDLVVMAGVRELDDGEDALLEGSSISRLSPPFDSGDAALLRDLGERAGAVYVHLDLDVLDTSVGRANRYARPGGYSKGDLVSLLTEVRKACRVRAMALTSYDPSEDESGAICEAALAAVEALVG